MVTTMIEHAPADLWIMSFGTKCFEDPSLLDEGERFRALSIKGVSDAVPILVSFAPWRMASGGTTPVVVVGSDQTLQDCIPGMWSRARSMIFRFPTRWQSTSPISNAWDPKEWAMPPKSAVKECKYARSRTASDHSRRRPTYSRCSIGRGPIQRPRRTRLRICSFTLPAAPMLRSFAAGYRQPFQNRGSNTRRVRQPQSLVLAVRNRRRRGPIRRCPARHDRRHRHRRPDPLFKHQGVFERIRDTACDRIVRACYIYTVIIIPGAVERGDRILRRCSIGC